MKRVTIVKLALLLGGLFGPCAALQTTKGWRAEKALPFSMCAHSLLLFAFGMFLPFSWCVSGLLVLDTLAWLYAAKRSGSVSGLLRVFKDPVWWLTVLIVPVLYYACCNRRLMSYDEYSHWGLMIKNIVAFDALPRRGAGAAFVLYDYPPMGALFPAMVCRIFGYRDGMAYFGYELLLLLLTLAAGLVPPEATTARKTVAYGLVLLCLTTLFPFSVLRLFSEPMIAMLFALCLRPVFRREADGMERLADLCAAMALALTKNDGIFFVALALAIRLAAGEKKERRDCLKDGTAAALAYVAYALYRAANGIASNYQPETGGRLADWLSGRLAKPFSDVPGLFVSVFFSRKFPQAGVYSCYALGVSAAVLFAALTLICAWIVLLSVDRKKTARLFGALYAGQALYLLMLMATYMFFFAEDEAQWLAEFDRYVSLPALLIALTACMALTWNESRMRTRSGAAMLAMTAALIPIDHPELMRETFITREAVIKTLWENSGTDSVVAFLRENMELSTMRRLYLMGDCRYIFLYEQLMPQAMVEEQRADSMEAMQKRLDEGRYDYAFVGNLEPDGFLAQGGLQANTLYAVVYDEAGRATLERAASME